MISSTKIDRGSASAESKDNGQKMTVSFPLLDYTKLIMALLVVEIHTKPLMALGNETVDHVVSGIDCVAVPFFFIASGFLCFRGLNPSSVADRRSNASQRIKSTIRKLLFLYVTWFALLLPLDIVGHESADHGLILSVVYEVRGFLFVGEGLYSWPLWYLLASVVAFSLVYLLLRGGVASSA